MGGIVDHFGDSERILFQGEAIQPNVIGKFRPFVNLQGKRPHLPNTVALDNPDIASEGVVSLQRKPVNQGDHRRDAKFPTTVQFLAKLPFGLGSYYALAEEAVAELAKQGIDATIINPRFATGIDEATLTGLCADHQVVVTLENGVVDGGFGEKIARFYGNCDMRVLVKGLKKEFYDKVPYGELMERNRLTPKQIAEDVMAVLK